MIFSLFFNYPSKEELRNELLGRWYEYAFNNNMQPSFNDIYTLEVGGQKKMEQYFWNQVVFRRMERTWRFIKSIDIRQSPNWIQLLKRYYREVLMLSFYIVLCFVFCLPFFCFLSLFFLFNPGEAMELYICLARGILVSRNGVYIFRRKVEAFSTPDFYYHPVMIISVYFFGMHRVYTVEEAPESEIFLQFKDIVEIRAIVSTHENKYFVAAQSGYGMYISEGMRISILDAMSREVK
eukprot:snap_masked-scaffold_8-processed-gene-6.31-mRNA-1 protein AED:1.00 eAED:1.00 QI:0/-1/0/0/-1/1/1/0/236